MPTKPHQRFAYGACGRLRQLALFAMGAMGLWPLVLQVALVPESVFGDGHGDRYEHLSYFAMENAHYQVLSPFKVDCHDLQATLSPGNPAPTPTKDLIRAVSEAVFKTTRSLVVNQTTAATAVKLAVATDILGLATDKSVCFGGVDDEGSVQIEALLSRTDATSFGLDASCLQEAATHFRVRLQSTEFFSPDTMGELNPTRLGGAMFIVSLVDQQLAAVVSSCHAATRDVRYKATVARAEYVRLVSVYSPQLLVSDSCDAFVLYGGTRDALGCAYASVGASGAVVTIGSPTTFAFPAPWRMIQCTVVGECSSLLFTQLWLSEWTVETAASGQVLRHNLARSRSLHRSAAPQLHQPQGERGHRRQHVQSAADHQSPDSRAGDHGVPHERARLVRDPLGRCVALVPSRERHDVLYDRQGRAQLVQLHPGGAARVGLHPVASPAHD